MGKQLPKIQEKKFLEPLKTTDFCIFYWSYFLIMNNRNNYNKKTLTSKIIAPAMNKCLFWGQSVKFPEAFWEAALGGRRQTRAEPVHTDVYVGRWGCWREGVFLQHAFAIRTFVEISNVFKENEEKNQFCSQKWVVVFFPLMLTLTITFQKSGRR